MGRIEEFLGLYKSKPTIQVYRMALKTYFNFIYSERGDLEEKANKYIAEVEERSYEKDLENFQTHLKKPLETVSIYLAVIRCFLTMNGVLIGDGEDQTWPGVWLKPPPTER
ncbi:MAG: hypothetical protein V1850_07720 [Candidatus Bathyarchaeota archaeon]